MSINHRNPVLSIEQSLQFLKRERRAFYDSIKSIVCPVLNNAEIHFTAHGFNHLINESNSRQGRSKPRKASEQYLKLMNLQYVPYIVTNCIEVAEIRPVKKKDKSIWKGGYHYELTCEIEKVGRVSVVIEKIGNGKYKFLSVFPHHSKSKIKKRPKGRS